MFLTVDMCDGRRLSIEKSYQTEGKKCYF